MDTFKLMNISPELINNVKNTYKIWSGFVLLRKCLNSTRFVGEWLTYCQDERIVTDIKSCFCKEDEAFIDNRHDQSVLSLLFKKWGLPMEEMSKYFLFSIRNPLEKN
jgi:hypothetical protein